METIKIKMVAEYKTHTIKQNKAVDITFGGNYDELTGAIKLMQLLNENVDIMVRKGSDKPFALGQYMIKEIKIAGDGCSTLKFNSQMDYVECNNLNILTGDVLQIMFKSTIDPESEED